MRNVWLLMLLTSCVTAQAGTRVPTDCDGWPKETRLELPTDTVAALDWHDANWKRGKAAHTDCRDAYRALASRVNNGVKP